MLAACSSDEADISCDIVEFISTVFDIFSAKLPILSDDCTCSEDITSRDVISSLIPLNVLIISKMSVGQFTVG